MTQLPMESSNPVDTSLRKEKMIASVTQNRISGSSSPQSYSPGGPHGALRERLLWANRLLAYDVNESVSVICLRELKEALLAFQASVRVQRVPLGPDMGVSSPSPSSTQAGRRSSGKQSVKTRTRNFKS